MTQVKACSAKTEVTEIVAWVTFASLSSTEAKDIVKTSKQTEEFTLWK